MCEVFHSRLDILDVEADILHVEADSGCKTKFLVSFANGPRQELLWCPFVIGLYDAGPYPAVEATAGSFWTSTRIKLAVQGRLGKCSGRAILSVAR